MGNPQLLIGHRYRLLRKIGEGGMATVHLAVDEKLGRDIAIKILREKYESHAEIRSRFQHEAKAISAFDHPNILKIYDYSGESSSQLWIVTELIHGRNLSQILETTPSGWLHPIIAAAVVREICKALATAHDSGVVHRDVKPENVMITHQGHVKLMDFGIAKIQRFNSMTQTGLFMGSPSYMSPEQVRGKDVDFRSDLYNLGVLFYELTTGKLPFVGPSTADVAMRILSGEFVAPRYVIRQIPEELNSLISDCMASLPEQRPPSADHIGLQLDRFFDSLNLDGSARELERCFQNPKTYGERLSRILTVEHDTPKKTIIISDTAKKNWDALQNPAPKIASGQSMDVSDSPRRDHQVPPRFTPRFTRRMETPAEIVAHLPERRLNHRPAHIVQAPHVKNRDRAPSPRPKSSPSPVIKPVARAIPIAPKRSGKNPAHLRPAVAKVRYVMHDPRGRNSSFWGFVGKSALTILIGMFIWVVWQSLPSMDSPRINRMVMPKKQKKTATLAQKSEDRIQTSSDNHKSQADQKTLGNAGSTSAEKSSLATREDSLTPAKSKADQSVHDLKQDSVQKNPTNQSSGLKIKDKPVQQASSQKKPQPRTPDPNSSTSSTVQINEMPAPSVAPSVAKSNTQETHFATSEPSKVLSQTNGYVVVASQPAAEIYIDGHRKGTTNDLGTTSARIELTPGNHNIELRRFGFTPFSQSVVVKSSVNTKLGPFSLERTSVPVSESANAKLTIICNEPQAKLTILNLDSGESRNVSLTEPTQTLSIKKSVYELTIKIGPEIRKRRVDLSGSNDHLTVNATVKERATP